MKILIALLLIVPTLEIWLMIVASQTFGWLPTILTIIATGVVGAWLAKKQGLAAFRAAQAEMRQGRLPGEALLDGLIVLIGGLLLLTPGFFTDLIGILCLLRFSREAIKLFVKGWLWKNIQNGRLFIYRGGIWRR